MGINAELTQAASAAKTLQTALQAAFNANTGQINMTQFSQQLKLAGTNVATLGASLRNAGTQGQAAFAQLSKSVSLMDVPIKQANKTLTTMMTTLKNTAKWEMASGAVHGIEKAFSNALNYVTDLNEALTDIRVVSGQTVEQMTKFTTQANLAAKALGTTTKEYAKAALTYYQQGDSSELAAKKAEITLKATNVAFKATASEMSDMLTSTWNGFQAGADELEHMVDVMANLGSHTASSVEEIATALQKVAATANTVGVSMEQVSAMIATVSSTTRQAASTVGTAMNTILSRFSSLKLGETLEDGLDLTKYSKALKTVGVDILDTSGNLRDMGIVIDELMEKWDNLSKGQKTALANTVGGVRQQTNVMALFENQDRYKQNLGYAENSEGALDAMQDTYMEGIEAAKKRLQASKEELWGTLINEKDILSATKAMTGLVEGITNVVDSLGGLKGITTSIGAIFLNVFSKQIGASLTNTINKFQTFKASFEGMTKGQAFLSFFKESTNQRMYNNMNQQFQQETAKAIAGTNDPAMLEQYSAIELLLQKKQELANVSSQMSTQDLAAAQSQLNMLQLQADQITQIGQEYKTAESNVQSLTNSIKDSTEAMSQARTASDRATAKKVDESRAESAINFMGGKSAFNGDLLSDIDTEKGNTVEQMITHYRLLNDQISTCADATKALENYQTMTWAQAEPQIKSATTILEAYRNELQQTGQTAAASEIDKLITKLQSADSTNFATTLDQVTTKLQVLESSGITGATNAFEVLATTLKVPEQLLRDMANGSEEARQKIIQLTSSGQDLTDMASKMKIGAQNMSKSISQIASSFGSAVMGFNAFSNGIGNWDTSNATSKLMSLSQAITVVGSTINAVVNGNWVGAIIMTIVTIAGILDGINKRAEKAAETAFETSNQDYKDLEEKQKANKVDSSVLTSYNELYATYEKTGDKQEELITSAEKLADAYNITGASVLLASGNFDEFNKKLREAVDIAKEGKELQDLLNAANTSMSDFVSPDKKENKEFSPYVGSQLSGPAGEMVDYAEQNENPEQAVTITSKILSTILGALTGREKSDDEYMTNTDDESVRAGLILKTVLDAYVDTDNNEQRQALEAWQQEYMPDRYSSWMDMAHTRNDTAAGQELYNAAWYENLGIEAWQKLFDILGIDSLEDLGQLTTFGGGLGPLASYIPSLGWQYNQDDRSQSKSTAASGVIASAYDQDWNTKWDNRMIELGLGTRDANGYAGMTNPADLEGVDLARWLVNNEKFISELTARSNEIRRENKTGYKEDIEYKTLQAIIARSKHYTENEDVMNQAHSYLDNTDIATLQTTASDALTEFVGQSVEDLGGIKGFYDKYSELAAEIDANQEDYEALRDLPFGSAEYIAARHKIITGALKDKTALTDQFELMETLAEDFGDSTSDVVDWMQENGFSTLEEISPYLSRLKLLTASGKSIKDDAGLASLVKSNKAVETAGESGSKYAAAISAQGKLKENGMTQSDYEAIYDAYSDFDMFDWDTFVAKDYAGRKAYLQSITDSYLETAQEDAQIAQSLAEEDKTNWETDFKEFLRSQGFDEEQITTKAYEEYFEGRAAALTDFQRRVNKNLTQQGDSITFEPDETHSWQMEKNEYGGYTLYGSEWNEETQDWESGLDWDVDTAEQAFDVIYSGIYASKEAYQAYTQAISEGKSIDEAIEAAKRTATTLGAVESAADKAREKVSKLSAAFSSLPTSVEDMNKVLEMVNASNKFNTNRLADGEKITGASSTGVLYTNKGRQINHTDLNSDQWTADMLVEKYRTDRSGYEQMMIDLAEEQYNGMTEGSAKAIAGVELEQMKQTHAESEMNKVLQVDKDDLAETTDGIKALQSAYKDLFETGKLSDSTKTLLEKAGISTKDIKTIDDVNNKMKELVKNLQTITKTTKSRADVGLQKYMTSEYAHMTWDQLKAELQSKGMWNEKWEQTGQQAVWDQWSSDYWTEKTTNEDWENTKLQLNTEKATKTYSRSKEQIKSLNEEVTKMQDGAKTLGDHIYDGYLTATEKAKLAAAGFSESVINGFTKATTAEERAVIAANAYSEMVGKAAEAHREQNKELSTAHKLMSGYNAEYQANQGRGVWDIADIQTNNKDRWLERMQSHYGLSDSLTGIFSEAWDAAALKFDPQVDPEKFIAAMNDYLSDAVDANDAAYAEIKAGAIDAMSNAYQQMNENARSAAAEQIEIWKSAFESISNILLGMAEGKSFASMIVGDTDAAVNAMHQLVAQGYGYIEAAQMVANGTAGDILTTPTLNTTSEYLKTTNLDAFLTTSYDDQGKLQSRRVSYQDFMSNQGVKGLLPGETVTNASAEGVRTSSGRLISHADMAESGSAANIGRLDAANKKLQDAVTTAFQDDAAVAAAATKYGLEGVESKEQLIQALQLGNKKAWTLMGDMAEGNAILNEANDAAVEAQQEYQRTKTAAETRLSNAKTEAEYWSKAQELTTKWATEHSTLSGEEKAKALESETGRSQADWLTALNQSLGTEYESLSDLMDSVDDETLARSIEASSTSFASEVVSAAKTFKDIVTSEEGAQNGETDASRASANAEVASAEAALTTAKDYRMNKFLSDNSYESKEAAMSDMKQEASIRGGVEISDDYFQDVYDFEALKQALVDNDDQQQALKDLESALTATTGAFDILASSTATAAEKTAAYTSLAGVLTDFFGEFQVSREFIDANAEAMKEWANGSEEAAETIEKNILTEKLKQFGKDIDACSDAISELNKIGNNMKLGQKLSQMGDEGKKQIQSLKDIQKQLGLTNAQMDQLAETMGLTINRSEQMMTAQEAVETLGFDEANAQAAKAGKQIKEVSKGVYEFVDAENAAADAAEGMAEAMPGEAEGGELTQTVNYEANVEDPDIPQPPDQEYSIKPIVGGVHIEEVSASSSGAVESAVQVSSTAVDGSTQTSSVSGSSSSSDEQTFAFLVADDATSSKTNTTGNGQRGGGGGGGGRRNKQKKDDHDRTRYHQTDRQLKKQNDLLTKNDKLKSRKYGSGYLDSLKAENKELKNQIDLNKEKIKEAQKYLEKDKKELEQNGATFDEDGNIDYDAYEKKWQDEYNRMVDQYNNGAIDDDAWTEFQKKYDNAMDAVERYEEAQDRIAEAQEAILEAQNQISANKLEMVTYELELKVELDQRQIDLLQTMLKLYENDLDKSSKLLTNYIEQMRLLQHQSNAAPEALANLMSQAGISSLDKIKQDKDGFIIPTVDGFDGDKMTVSDFAEGLKSIADQAQSSLDAIIEMRETMLSFYGDVIDKGEEKFSALANTMKHLNNMMSGYLELVDLYNTGGDVWDKKATIMEAQYDTQLQTIDMYEARMKLYQQQETELEAELQKDPTNEAAKRALEDLKETKEQAEEEWLDAVKTAAQTAKDLYQNSVDEIMDQMNKLNGDDMDWLKTKADLWKKNNDLYVDDVTKIYEIDKLTRKIEDSIADTRSKSNQAELKALKEKIKLQADSNELSEYDIEMMNKEYELLLAKQELENAKDAKNQVRLTRDENGNMIYQYTTDQDAVSEAEQKYNDVLYEMHKTSKEHLNDLYENLQETEEAYRAAVEQIWNDATLTAEEKQQRLDEVNEAYGKILDNLGSQIEITYGNLTDYDTRLSNRFAEELKGTAFDTDKYLNTTLVAMSKKADDFKQGMINCQTALVGALDSYSNRVDSLQEHTHTKWEDMTSDLGKFKTAATNTKNETDKLIETLKKSLEDAMTRIIKDFKNWNSEIEKTIKNLSSMIDKINAVLTALASLGDDRRDGGRRDGDDGRRDGDDGRRDGGRRDGDDGRRDGGDDRRGGGGTRLSGWKYDATHHWRQNLDTGAIVQKAAHTYSGPITNGTKCTVCGRQVTAYTPKSYNPDPSPTQTQQPTSSGTKPKVDSRVRVPGSVRAATGGLIDYTGPAWVDGTEPNPEYVLNADQTKMMFGILSSGVMDKLLNALIYAAQAMSMTSLNANNLANSYTSALSDASSSVQQTVYVKADFPAATDKQEIVSALTEIYNKTSHYVNRQTTVGL